MLVCSNSIIIPSPIALLGQRCDDINKINGKVADSSSSGVLPHKPAVTNTLKEVESVTFLEYIGERGGNGIHKSLGGSKEIQTTYNIILSRTRANNYGIIMVVIKASGAVFPIPTYMIV